MTTIVTRASNGAPLTNTQMDTNLTNLNNNKLELSGGTVTGQIKGITPVSAEDLTRKDYVDSILTTANVLSGTYTPTFSSYSNCSAASIRDSRPFRYTRVGNIITLSGMISLTVTASGSAYFYFTAPVAPDIVNRSDVAGSGWARNSAAVLAIVEGDAGSDLLALSFTSPGSGATVISFVAQYLIS